MLDLLYEIPQNCDFNEIVNGSNQEYSCSPKLSDPFFSKFEGMLINAPAEVVWYINTETKQEPTGPWGQTSGSFRLMLAGLINAPYKSLELKGKTSRHVVVIAVNKKTGMAYIGKMPSPNFVPVPAKIKNLSVRLRSENELNASISDHFNLDLVHDLGLPIADAIYHVYAT